ncbi:MAG: quinolinate synthase NadA, partial [bacterium]|nr:quinolinate synthase NadA [bacterium]
MSMIANDIQHYRQQWGEDLLILGHHYQDSSIIPFCDAVGDSLELSRIAAASKAKRIVFCGVRFMAETADVLSRALDGIDNGRRVYQPAPNAGCPMADMATADALEAAWKLGCRF